MSSRSLQHVNLRYPAGAEAEARAFYAGTLGLDELAKPPEFSPEGLWFRLEGGSQLHLSPGRPAPPGPWHFCLVVDDFDALRHRLDRELLHASEDACHQCYDHRHRYQSRHAAEELLRRQRRGAHDVVIDHQPQQLRFDE